MAYTADIQIAVRGATQITNLQQQLVAVSKAVSQVNRDLGARGLVSNSLQNLKNVSSQAERAMRAAASGTRAQQQAIDVYVKSVAAAERAETRLTAAIKQRQRELGLAQQTASRSSGSGGGGGRLGGIVSNAVIGGAFPLLFGQGGGAAAGGAIGGAVGGLFGGAGGFAGSLLGTLIGDLASQGQQVRQLAADIGFSAEQTKQLEGAFKLAGQEADKFTDAVQNIRGLGLTLEDQANAIKLVSALTETYGGKIDKVTNAFTSAFESGKVTQATLNQLTSQGIPIQDELARKYGVSRDAILKMAKDGKISVQTLSDTLVDMGNKGIEAGQKPKSAFDSFSEALGNTATAVGNVANTLLQVLSPVLDQIINKATLALNAINETINTELLRTKIQSQSGKILSPETLQKIEKEAMSMAARRFPSQAKGRQLAAGPGIISPRAQQEFQILREQLIRNELQRFGFESGVLTTPKAVVQQTQIGRITAPAQAAPSGGRTTRARKPSASLSDLLGSAADESVRSVTSTVLLENQRRINDALAAGDKRTAQLYEDQQRFIPLGIQLQAIEQQRSMLLERQAEFIAKGVEPIKIKNKLEELNARYAQIQADSYLELGRLAGEVALRDTERTNAISQILFSLDIEEQKAIAKTEAQRLVIEMLVLENQLKQQGIILTDKEREAIIKKMEAVSKAQQKQRDSQRDIEAAVNQAGGLMLNTIEALISRTQSWQNVFRSLLADVGSLLFRLGISMLGGNDGTGFFSILSGNFGRRAGGGAVNSQRPYLVGERGPELFVPGTGGSVVSTSDLRSAMGPAPGSGGAPVLNMSFETTSINGVEYVSREQLEAAMAATRRQATRDGAQRGMTMTLDRLQQSPNARRRVGI